MAYLSNSSARFKQLSPSSTANWRAWWREQSKADGTDWPSLCWQHIGALRAVRTLAESSGTSS
jgi:hypothetical protein